MTVLIPTPHHSLDAVGYSPHSCPSSVWLLSSYLFFVSLNTLFIPALCRCLDTFLMPALHRSLHTYSSLQSEYSPCLLFITGLETLFLPALRQSGYSLHTCSSSIWILFWYLSFRHCGYSPHTCFSSDYGYSPHTCSSPVWLLSSYLLFVHLNALLIPALCHKPDALHIPALRHSLRTLQYEE